MALLEVLKAGNPVLKQVSVPVERIDKKLIEKQENNKFLF